MRIAKLNNAKKQNFKKGKLQIVSYPKSSHNHQPSPQDGSQSKATHAVYETAKVVSCPHCAKKFVSEYAQETHHAICHANASKYTPGCWVLLNRIAEDECGIGYYQCRCVDADINRWFCPRTFAKNMSRCFHCKTLSHPRYIWKLYEENFASHSVDDEKDTTEEIGHQRDICDACKTGDCTVTDYTAEEEQIYRCMKNS